MQVVYLSVTFVFILLQNANFVKSGTCSIGNTIENRGFIFKDGVVVVFPTMDLTCFGYVTDWEYWTNRPGRFRAFIVRPTTGNFHRFSIVGINDIHVTSAKMKAIYEVPLKDRFTVQSGDMIAVGIPSTNNNPQLSVDQVLGTESRYIYKDSSSLSTGGYLITKHIGNSTGISISVRIGKRDNEAPTITGLPSGLVVDTDPGFASAMVEWQEPTVTDNVGPVTVTSNFISGDRFPLGATNVVYTAIDPSNNEGTATFAVTVVDNEAPTITGLPSGLVVNTDPGFASAMVEWQEPTVTDNVGPVTVTSNFISGDRFPLGSTNVMYTAIDPSDNEGTATFAVTVVDNEAPTITGLPSGLVVNTDPGFASAMVEWQEPTVTDNVGPVTVTSNFISGDRFPLCSTNVMYTAIDPSDNEGTATFAVTVVDVEPPIILDTPHSFRNNTDPNSATATVWWTPPTAGDNSDEPVTLISNYSPGDKFPIGNTVVNYTAGDVNGNTASSMFEVFVVDNEPPSILNTPPSQNVTIVFESVVTPVLWTPPTTSDNSGEPVTLTCDYIPGDKLPIGNTTITYKAIDSYGNWAFYSFNVIVSVRKRNWITWIIVGSAGVLVIIAIITIVTSFLICRRKKTTQNKELKDMARNLKSTRAKVLSKKNEYHQHTRATHQPEHNDSKTGALFNNDGKTEEDYDLPCPQYKGNESDQQLGTTQQPEYMDLNDLKAEAFDNDGQTEECVYQNTEISCVYQNTEISCPQSIYQNTAFI